jgi:BirA family biotin operon repressor/biotin-[acetyl-CoA-carboxylase] ligase
MTGPWERLDRPPLSAAALRRAITSGDRPAWRALDVVPATGSTNADLAERARDGEPEGLVLTTDDQRAGRGRLDRRWTAPPRSAVAVSVLLRPPVPPARWSWLSLLAGVAVTDALVRTCGLGARLKWPNDVLVPVDGELRKVGGILIEVHQDQRTEDARAAVLGIGLNVHQDAGELPVPTATSLRLAGAATTDRDTVLRAVLRALSDRYAAWCAAAGDPRAGGVAASYRERCATIGAAVEVHLPDGGRLSGVAEGVDDEGRLLVRDSGSPSAACHALAAGDVVHVRPGSGPGAVTGVEGAAPGANGCPADVHATPAERA